ncbi:MotA/TolQ/ExbB proton channel family protein [Zavarzinella formosa]|uniref:MotA/TolQ/ExbB proton channel family protein n=1 Tax=Zavarzinella formosa TaxID=360055 RepID=UPI0002FED31C|nr:MotA/TolQ/ExbB proton channel family protein [Zavarzinella formosa]
MLELLTRRRWVAMATFLLAVLVLLLTADPSFAQEGDAARPDKSIFLHIIESAGWVFMVVLGLPSIALVALIVLLLLDLRMSVAIPPGFVDEFIDTVNKRRFKEAFDMARNDSSFLGRVLTAGMSRLQYGLEDARDAASNMLDSIRSGKEQLNNYTAVIGSLGPLIGLVGTVLGMIRAFMSLGKGGPPNPAELAKGISEALSVTFLGIGISVPAIFFNAFFRNRIISVSMDTSHIADDLLTQMYHNSKKAGGVPTGTTGTTATAGPASAPPPPPPPAPAR